MPKKHEIDNLQMSFIPLTNVDEKYPWSNSTLYRNIFTTEALKPLHCRQHGLLFQADSLVWLKTLKDSSVDLVFADPP